MEDLVFAVDKQKVHNVVDNQQKNNAEDANRFTLLTFQTNTFPSHPQVEQQHLPE